MSLDQSQQHRTALDSSFHSQGRRHEEEHAFCFPQLPGNTAKRVREHVFPQDLLHPSFPRCLASSVASLSLHRGSSKEGKGAPRGQAPLTMTSNGSPLRRREGKRKCCLLQDRNKKFGAVLVTVLSSSVHAHCVCSLRSQLGPKWVCPGRTWGLWGLE